MEDPKERLSKSISTPELERRWKAVREKMKEEKIDYLVIQNQEEYLGGTIRWFIDFTARHQFPVTVIFPVDDEMTTIVCGSEPPAANFWPPPWAKRGIKQTLGGIYFLTVSYTGTRDAEIAVDVLKEKKKPTIGLVERTFIPITFYEYLVKNLPGAKFVDATELVDEIRVIKSPEEIELIRGTAALQDAAIETLKKIVKPGIRDLDVYAEMHCFASKRGSERGLVLVGSGPLGSMVAMDVPRFQQRVIKEGDQVTFLIEVNGPGGYYTEEFAIITVGKEPNQALRDAFTVSLEAEKLIAKHMVPGAEPGEIWNIYKEFITKAGYLPPGRNFAHGQGLSLVDRPTLHPSEPWKLKAGMNIAVHPSAVKPGSVLAITGSNYLVTEKGAERLHKVPREIIVV